MRVLEISNILVDLTELMRRPGKMTEDALRRRFFELFEQLRIAAGIVEMDHADFGPLDFVASILLTHHLPGKTWCGLDDRARAEYRQKAVNTVSSWASNEMMVKKAATGRLV